MNHRYVVIMAGGRGERFWPASRLDRPKHLLPIVGDRPMLDQTVQRVQALVPPGHVLVITNSAQRDAVCEICPSLPPQNIIAEPVGRDTAAAVGLALLMVQRRDPLGVFAMLPADHVIGDVPGFAACLEAAFQTASESDVLVTIGIRPTEPATGFGYIQRGEPFGKDGDQPVYQARRFVEKPDLETAEKYLASGDYLWNAGMFVWRAHAIKAAFSELAPEVDAEMDRIGGLLAAGGDLAACLAEVYPKIPRISVDYAILEKARNVVVIPGEFDWDDVGSWPAVARHFPKDPHDNVLRGRCLVEEGSGNILVGSSDHLLAVVGADDLIVVRTADATLVCPKSKAEQIKRLVERMKEDPELRKLL